MSGAELIAIVAAFASLLLACAQLVTALVSYARLGQVHSAVNGQTDKLVDLTATTSFAAGVRSGRRESDLPANPEVGPSRPT